MSYNKQLAEKQGCTEIQKKKLDELYKALSDLFEEARNETRPSALRLIASKVELIEFELQENWNFTKDKTKHSYWYQIPQCSCPLYDNRDLFGVDVRIYSDMCKIHGNITAE